MFKRIITGSVILLASHMAFAAELNATYSCDRYNDDPKLLDYCQRAVAGIEKAKQVHKENEQARLEAIEELKKLQEQENELKTEEQLS